jgi:hypothetical protein
MKHEYVFGFAIFGLVLFGPVIAGLGIDLLAWLLA